MSGEQAEIPPRAIDFTFRFDPDDPTPFFAPQDWEEARLFLQGGNESIGRFFDACRRGKYADGEKAPVINLSALEALNEPKGPDGLLIQYPFAVVFGCSDARVPTEILFGQEFNDIFTIRVAGNLFGPNELGSLMYALNTFVPDSPTRPRSLKIVVALGHLGCGAVRATVDAYQAQNLEGRSDSIGKLLEQIASPSLGIAAKALEEAMGQGAAMDKKNAATLANVTVYANAAWTAMQIQSVIDELGPGYSDRVAAVYGVFDPNTVRVHAYAHDIVSLDDSQLVPPPANLYGLAEMARVIVRSMRSNLV